MAAHKTPNERKRAAGNPGKRPIPEPIGYLPAAIATPDVPDHIRGKGSEVWERLLKYADSWISPDTDIELLTRYCELYDLRDTMRAQIATQGVLIDDAPHPLLRHMSEADKQLTAYEAKLGLTPSDRAHLGLVEIKKQTGIQQYLANQQGPARKGA